MTAGGTPTKVEQPPQEPKLARSSMTTWGTVVAVLGGLGALAEATFPQYFPPGTTHSIGMIASQIVSGAMIVAGGIAAIMGRVRAKGPLVGV